MLFSIVSYFRDEDNPKQPKSVQEIPLKLHGKWKIAYINDVDVTQNIYFLEFSHNRIIADYTGHGGKISFSVSATSHTSNVKSNTPMILIKESPSLKYPGYIEFEVKIPSIFTHKSHIDIIVAKKI